MPRWTGSDRRPSRRAGRELRADSRGEPASGVRPVPRDRRAPPRSWCWASARAIKAPVIACVGLAYRADVDDLRESPAIAVIERLQESAPAGLLVVEPHVRDLPPELSGTERTRVVPLETASPRHRSYCRSPTIRSFSMSTFSYFLQRELSIHAGSRVRQPTGEVHAHRTPVGRGMNE